ncbi:zinc ABC transporter substrate-binding protein [Cognatishimia sp. SS12]|uniref:zinc ABC transporter substrate-binding protein n=1 Tax=Cognatishimia sp. SS12 TaxID=2979465 RepID=UPI00233127A3|nr:zinc ABC transporter substrate-binding protein [Cognatishimia sp. SS12]MDC0737871.1 zinc ABC transporter substrate-binding protein [Cognatishimia sp. SS12]
MFKHALALSCLLSAPALADAPKVTTDIAPVHALTARVMQGVGTPDLLLPPGLSPHDYAMRPSDARNLQSADLVIWMGEALTPWLEHPLETLAQNARQIELLHLDVTEVLPTRTDAVFASGDDDHGDHDDHDTHHDQEHGDHHEDDHDTDAHHDHDHEEAHESHEDAHGQDDGHNHGAEDPHAWLSPENAQAWMIEIAAQLAEIDPQNAELYMTNAKVGASEIAALTEELQTRLAPLSGTEFIVTHDAFQYFEHSFGLTSAGALQVSDAVPPSAARLAAIQHEIEEHQITCIFSEPQLSDAVLRSVAPKGTVSATLDPLGSRHAIGATLYLGLLHDLAEATESCLTAN